MTQYIDKDALVAEIKKLISNYKGILNKVDKSSDDWVDLTLMLESKIDVLQHILSFLDTLEVKEVEEETESIWHDANHQPTMYRKYLVRYSDGKVSGSWERHDDGFIPWKDVVKEHGFTYWCYVEDLIKL